MSLDPQIPLPPFTVAPPPVPPPPRFQPEYRWYHKVSALTFILFCMALGAVLVVFPWLDDWHQNFFSALVPEWHNLWDNSYVRGAISGLGVVNFYIAFLEILRLRRFAGRGDE
jgi:hypothetical protein